MSTFETYLESLNYSVKSKCLSSCQDALEATLFSYLSNENYNDWIDASIALKSKFENEIQNRNLNLSETIEWCSHRLVLELAGFISWTNGFRSGHWNPILISFFVNPYNHSDNSLQWSFNHSTKIIFEHNNEKDFKAINNSNPGCFGCGGMSCYRPAYGYSYNCSSNQFYDLAVQILSKWLYLKDLKNKMKKRLYHKIFIPLLSCMNNILVLTHLLFGYYIETNNTTNILSDLVSIYQEYKNDFPFILQSNHQSHGDQYQNFANLNSLWDDIYPPIHSFFTDQRNNEVESELEYFNSSIPPEDLHEIEIFRSTRGSGREKGHKKDLTRRKNIKTKKLKLKCTQLKKSEK